MINSIFRWLRGKDEEYVIDGEKMPEDFLRLTAEMRDLSEMARYFIPPEADELRKQIVRLRLEIEQLDSLAGQEEFYQMPREKREQIWNSLLFSRRTLLDTVQSAPVPSSFMQ